MFHGISLIFICYRVTPVPCRPTSVTRRSDTADARGRAVVYQNASGHTVAPPGLHRESTVANRSINGTYRDHFLPQTGSGPKRCWECINALEFLHDSSRFALVRRLQTAETHRGVHRDSVNGAFTSYQ